VVTAVKTIRTTPAKNALLGLPAPHRERVTFHKPAAGVLGPAPCCQAVAASGRRRTELLGDNNFFHRGLLVFADNAEADIPHALPPVVTQSERVTAVPADA